MSLNYWLHFEKSLNRTSGHAARTFGPEYRVKILWAQAPDCSGCAGLIPDTSGPPCAQENNHS
jgi:hypothetical protein